MNNKRRIMVLLMALLISAFLTLGCDDNWDGMDRSDWEWGATTTQTWTP